MQFLPNASKHPEIQPKDIQPKDIQPKKESQLKPHQRHVKVSKSKPREVLGKLGLWMLFWIVLADIGINQLFAYPHKAETASVASNSNSPEPNSPEPNSPEPNSLERYFDYGRSIEGKLNRMVASTVESSDPIINLGWIDPQAWESRPDAPKDDDDLLVAYYGMSFSDDIGRALTEIDSNITLRSIVGPSAPPNHSYAAYMADTSGRANADVVMFTVLSSSLKRMRSLSGLSWNYEHPSPYSYPYYHLNSQGELVAVEPAIANAEEFVSAFTRKGESWQQLKAQMAKYDVGFDPIVFNNSWTDKSALLRLLRRGWANRVRQRSDRGLYNPATGFNPEAPEIETLKVMFSNFVTTARDANQLPLIVIISDGGYDNSLYKILSPHFQSINAPALSTYELIPSDNPANFKTSGHFTPAANIEIAKALRKIMAEADL